MDKFAQSFVAGAGFAVLTPVMYYFNKAALSSLLTVNKAFVKALVNTIDPLLVCDTCPCTCDDSYSDSNSEFKNNN